METCYFDCQCSSFDHVFRFVLDKEDGDLWLEVQLRDWEPWYMRVWHALKYVFRRKVAYGFYDTTMIKYADIARLRGLLDQAEQAYTKQLLQYDFEGDQPPTEKPVTEG